MWLQKHKTTKVRSVIQWPASSQPWAGPQPHEPEHPPNLLTQNAGVRESWLIPFVFTQSTDGGGGDPEDPSITCSLWGGQQGGWDSGREAQGEFQDRKP